MIKFPEDKPFKDSEDVKTGTHDCAWMGSFVMIASLIFAVLGIFSDALDVTLVLESMSWFPLAIVIVLTAIIANMRSLTAKHLNEIEYELRIE